MAKVTPVAVYLVLYNVAQFAGWTFALYDCFKSLQGVGWYTSTYQQSGQIISKTL